MIMILCIRIGSKYMFLHGLQNFLVVVDGLPDLSEQALHLVHFSVEQGSKFEV